MIKGTRLLAACSLLVGLGACGDDATPAGEVSPDAETAQETAQETVQTETVTETTPTETVAETTPTETVAETTPTETVTPTCDQTGFTGDAYMEYDEANGFAVFGLANDNGEISIQLYDFGDGLPITGPGSYKLADTVDEQNYATCALCAMIYTDDQTFFATGGTLTVTSFDEIARQVNATLSDATFIEVEIDSASYESTPVPNGDTWCIASAPIVFEPECLADADCSGATPYCDTDSLKCVGCRTHLDCSASNPVCDGSACIEGVTVCTGDDANENHDDGPLGANAITVGGAQVNAKICGENQTESGNEFDYYTFTLAAPGFIEVTLTWTGADNDLDFYVQNADLEFESADGATVEGNPNPEVARLAALPAGKYYILVNSYLGAPVAAIDYQLSVTTWTPECESNADCTVAGKGVCDTDAYVCVACMSDLDCTAATPVCLNDGGEGVPNVCGVVDECTGDEADVNEHGDDGITGATVVTFPTPPLKAMICGDGSTPSGAEADYFKITIPADGSVSVTLEWALEEVDLDFVVIDGTGESVADGATSVIPETTTVSGVPAGDYYVVVYSYEGAATAALEYTLTMVLALP